ncbi:hypothetical protein PV327_005079 [Microctonus hyperodae]|nr:hypothetical protein PV327_005079 [Microctonus hyperodae]
MMNTYSTKKYTIAQFEEGLQVIPKCWLNEVKDKSMWPNHIKSSNTLEKSVKAVALPKNDENRDVCEDECSFESTDDWLSVKEELIEAEEISSLIESDKLSDNELIMELKKQRRKRVKTIISSDDDMSVPANNRNVLRKNKRTISQTKSADNLVLVAPPPFYSSTPAHTTVQAIRDEKNIHPSTSKHSQFYRKNIAHGSTGGNTDFANIEGDSQVDPDISESDFRRFVMKTLTSLAIEIKDLNNKIDRLTGATSISVERRDDGETSEDEFQKFPLIQTENDLSCFERKLKDQSFYNRMIRCLVNVGSGRLGMSVSAVCSRLIADSIAIKFSWQGRLKKRCFSKLTTSRLLQKTFKIISNEKWSTKEIDDAIAKWLTQAKTRISRAKNPSHDLSDS